MPELLSDILQPSPQLALFDSHCHLDLPELWPEWQQHWQQAQSAGVKGCLIPAVQASAWQPLLDFSRSYPEFNIALGIHPWWAAQHDETHLVLLKSLLEQHQSQIAAVGEIGLDYALAPETFARQQQLFEAQLKLAAEFQKPVVLHHRKSMVQLLAEIKRQQFQYGGILHAFSGSPEQGQVFVDVGFKLGIGGTITYPRAAKTQAAVRQLPLSCFVLETDAPAMPLSGFQGQINTPKQLALVFQAFCGLRQEAPTDIAAQLWRNSQVALGIS
ncbi:TatD family deoxyribonuclease [Rheinheimera riviphila]|uniref:TatD family deoxyribonuclease n=1 Tax=Rheinheimera riviphila TaxID=1834037 RepID=A0A437QS87_9GAMM|nr:TatD family hydrolase [Rheinheimera riviphila]RVU37376.1 TatD family deoxyribonuclease [Rheinheimera riviphila]